MPYPKKLLNDYETLALDLHPHWWFFAKAACALVGSIVVGIVVRVLLDGDGEKVLTWAAIVLIIISVVWLIVRYMKWATTNFVVTNDRVIFRAGVFAKSGIEIPLDRVNNVIFGQSVFERMIGAGDLVIESGGETGQQRFTDIRSPDRVQKLIHAQKSEKDRKRHTGGGATDVATQLEKLEGLLERGTITPDEFDEQKRKLLEG
jgi:uncharacterized membrane protein YdbT with pleckstrin-like domain